MIEGTARSDRCFHESQRRLVHLKEIKSVICCNQGTIKDEFEDQTPFKYFRAHRLKRIEAVVGIHSEWNMMETGNQDSEIDVNDFLTTLPQYPNLREFKSRLIRHPIDPETCAAIMQLLSQLKNLQHVVVDFISCSITDFDLMTIASELQKMPHLKEATFKVVQPAGLSIEIIQQFVMIVSRISNLQRLHLYFRKLPLEGGSMKDFAENLQQMSNNVRCSYGNQSLSVER